jgi:hypothetical protein
VAKATRRPKAPPTRTPSGPVSPAERERYQRDHLAWEAQQANRYQLDHRAWQDRAILPPLVPKHPPNRCSVCDVIRFREALEEARLRVEVQRELRREAIRREERRQARQGPPKQRGRPRTITRQAYEAIRGLTIKEQMQKTGRPRRTILRARKEFGR